MNKEMDALYKNDTWDITDLPIGIEVLETKQGLCLSQRKYSLDLLSDFGLLACKPSAAPLEQNLSITNEPTDIDKFMHKPLRSHLRIALRVLRYLKGNPGKGVHIVRAMASVTSEVIWILKILKELEWDQVLPVNLFCDSQAVIKIAANPVFHEKTKHLEIDLHFIRDKILAGVIKTQKTGTAVQPADIFTKGLDKLQHEILVSKLGLIDVFQEKRAAEMTRPAYKLNYKATPIPSFYKESSRSSDQN
ncbi:ribonuclease H-like domain-containing protein [Tanacetum coccineum]|uniref:Ribonuclease H-like domain-containing protein n=1 Tax=Tanacetum coccineum TaxID=301880 RepID=A0ABQ5C0N9_9ASTR